MFNLLYLTLMWKINVSDGLLVICSWLSLYWFFSITHAFKFTKWSPIPSPHRLNATLNSSSVYNTVCKQARSSDCLNAVCKPSFYWLGHSVYANDTVHSDVRLNAMLLDVWEAKADQDIYILVRLQT